MSFSIDSDFIGEVGRNVNEILTNDPSQTEWIDSVIEESTNNSEFPEDTLDKILDYLHSNDHNKFYTSLIDKINAIVDSEGIPDNLLNAIFYPDDFNEENDFHEEDLLEVDIIEGDEEEETSDTPNGYFRHIILETKNTLCISQDIAYLLLKKYGWNKDTSFNEWFSSQNKILKTLRLNIGSKMIPDLQSSLDIIKCETGKCPLCNQNEQLLQLYCGHKICEKCLNSELKTQINNGKLPFCHQLADDHNDCNSEIIIKSCEDHTLFEKYKNELLKDKLKNNSIDIKACPNPHCDYFITPRDRVNKYFACCSHCQAATCLRCNHGVHAPLDDCSKIEEFCFTIPSNMYQLIQDQEAWEKREIQLNEYRCKNADEVKKMVDQIAKDFQKEQENEVSSEQDKLNEYSQNIPMLNKQLDNIKQQIRNKINDPKETVLLSKKILSTRQEIDKNERLKIEYQQIMEENNRIRNIKLECVNKQNSILISGLSKPTNYSNSISDYHNKKMEQAYSLIPVRKDPEMIENQLEICPKCESTVSLVIGFNQMECKCGFKLCKVCLGKWDDKHNRYCTCPKYMIDKNKIKKVPSKCRINFKDTNDKKFYIPPLLFNDCVCLLLFENYYALFLRQKEFYENLKKDFYAEDTKEVQENITFAPNDKLCTRSKLIRVFEKESGQFDSQIATDKLLNSILLAQSVVVWGYSSIYFALTEKKTKKADYLFESISELKKKILDFLYYIKNPFGYGVKFFNEEGPKLANEAKQLLEDLSDF